jgi:hypothetical protein
MGEDGNIFSHIFVLERKERMKFYAKYRALDYSLFSTNDRRNKKRIHSNLDK